MFTFHLNPESLALSACELDHAPRHCHQSRIALNAIRQVVSDFHGGVAAEMPEEMVELLAPQLARLRIVDADHRHHLMKIGL